MLLKTIAKVAGFRKPHLFGDFHGFQIGGAEQGERPVHAQFRKVLMEGLPGLFFENHAEIGGRDV